MSNCVQDKVCCIKLNYILDSSLNNKLSNPNELGYLVLIIALWEEKGEVRIIGRTLLGLGFLLVPNYKLLVGPTKFFKRKVVDC